MKKFLRNKKGLTFVELLVAASISVLVMGVILMTWIFTYQTWKTEGSRTYLRVNLLEGLETVKEDIRLSSATFMSFYPSGSETKTAVSLPRADVDANGMYPLNAFGDIIWDRTIIYHVFTTDENQLRRTVISPRDNTLDHNERYTQLVKVVTDGDGAGLGLDPESHSTQILLKDLDTFEITPLAAIIDFFDDTGGAAVRVGKVVFGWAKLAAGDHTIRFEVTGKNDSATNYRLGIDYIKIEPSGCSRQAEYYTTSFAPTGSLTTSGEDYVIGSASRWSNEEYVRFKGAGVGDWIEFTDYYDLWRDSVFLNSLPDNVTEAEAGVYMKLEMPEDRDAGKEQLSWQPFYQTGDSNTDGRDTNMTTYPQTIRTIIPNTYIGLRGDSVRVKFKASSVNPFQIATAYITRRNGTSGEDGLANQSTGGLTIDEYHRHQQLFFKDTYDMDSDTDTEDIVPYVFIPANGEVWSEWTEFPLELEDSVGNPYDYFITFCVPDLAATTWPTGWTFDSLLNDIRYWNDSGGTTHTYYIDSIPFNNLLQAAGTPVWSGGTYIFNTTSNIFAATAIDVWSKTGTLESDIFDTRKDDPVYNQIKWSEDDPTGTEINMKARSSDDQFMAGAPLWDSISGSTSNPGSLAIGTGRYVQYYAELSSEPFWTCPTLTLNSADYVDTQLGLGSDYLFPQDSGEYLITGAYSTWFDDAEIDWPGDERICVISGYISRDTNYGQAKVIIDGQDIVKTLNVYIKFTTDVQERTVTEEGSVEVAPRNTGR
ncbi:MAG: prepilin-type N-terminal cleavage/methylation domain-containing protein [Candidatus Omnitrophota bacterium]